MEIKPDKKLFKKQLYVLLTISFFVLLVAAILQITIPLDPKITASGVAAILWPIVFGVIFFLWLIAVPIAKLWIKNLSYYIDEDRVTIHKGILSKIKQNVPYRAITDFQLHRSLFDRALRIGSIRVQTAGQKANPSGYEATLSGLVEWDELLEQLRAKVMILYPKTGAEATESSLLTENKILQNILDELKKIRAALSKN
jgi:uncharacterized membrane protein YdbT with pleckstrin-like domain